MDACRKKRNTGKSYELIRSKQTKIEIGARTENKS
jgi:hypothetical protein